MKSQILQLFLVDLKGFPPQGGINLESLAPRQNKKPPKGDFCFGGPEGIRTLDLSDANRTLSQLSYKPEYEVVPLQYVRPALPAELQARTLLLYTLFSEMQEDLY